MIVTLIVAVLSAWIGYSSAQDPQGSRRSVQLIGTPTTSIEVDIGSTVNYACVGYSESDPPDITWSHGERRLTNGSLVTIYKKLVFMKNFTFVQSILVLCSVRLEDGGIYSCSAINSIDNVTSTFTLNVKVTGDTIEDIVGSLAMQAQQSAVNPTQQTADNLTRYDSILSSVANFASGPNASLINDMIIENVVETLHSLLQWKPDTVMAYNSSRIVESFETIVSHYAAQILTNTSQNFTVTLLAVLVENIGIGTLQTIERNVAFTIDGLRMTETVTPEDLSPQQSASVSLKLPASLFQMMTSVGVFYAMYNTSVLFPVPVNRGNEDTSAPKQVQVVSSVVAITVGQNVTIQEPVEVSIAVRIQKKERMYTALNSEVCVSWDFNLQNWTPEGCNLTQHQNGVAVCHCNHLTNFAVLAEVCSTEEACSIVLDELKVLNASFNNLTVENYEDAVAKFSQVIQKSERSSVDQNPAVLNMTADYINELAIFLNNSVVMINDNVTRDLVQVVNSLLQWHPERVVVSSSSRIIQSFDLVFSLYAQQVSLNETKIFNESSIAFIVEQRSVQNLAENGRSFTIAGNKPETAYGDQVTPGELSPEEDASIINPGSLFKQISNISNVGIVFGSYNETTLFPVGKGSTKSEIIEGRQTKVGSIIASATVGLNLEFQNLEEPVNITFQLRDIPGMYMAPDSKVCAFWDFSLQDWNRQGCTTSITDGGLIICSCNHLTSFAVLVDICLRQKDCSSSKVELALNYISYIGISISIFCLILTLLSLIIFKKIRQKDVSKFHIQLSLAILFMFVVVLAFVGLSGKMYGGCVTVSILIHYFSLVALMWMGAEALLMFQKLVIVFVKNIVTTKYIVILSIICWCIPIIPVLIPLIVDMVNGREPDNDIVIKRGEKISFCFLSNEVAFWGAFLDILLLVMVFNLIIIICVIVVLIRHLRSKASLKKESVTSKKEAVDKKSILRLMLSICGVMSIFGLTWLFGIFTISVPYLREIFQILFTIFNSLQGFFIFLFVCVISSDVRDEWMKIFTCTKYKSWLTHNVMSSSKGYKLDNSSGAFTSSENQVLYLRPTANSKDKQPM